MEALREPPCLIETVAVLCALPLLLAYRMEEASRVGPVETLAWSMLLWGVVSSVQTWVKRHRSSAPL